MRGNDEWEEKKVFSFFLFHSFPFFPLKNPKLYISMEYIHTHLLETAVCWAGCRSAELRYIIPHTLWWWCCCPVQQFFFFLLTSSIWAAEFETFRWLVLYTINATYCQLTEGKNTYTYTHPRVEINKRKKNRWKGGKRYTGAGRLALKSSTGCKSKVR
jgi:hypothetical protein